MIQLIEKYQRRLKHTPRKFSRSLMNEIDWTARLIGIKGARGVGKTTLLLQYILKHIKDKNKALYLSLDDIYFSNTPLITVVDDFYKKGGVFLFLDEVHNYPNWSIELKNIYDSYPNLKIVFTESSLLNILDARSDLSRRAIVYTLQGLSFREFLALKYNIFLPSFHLDTILTQHTQLVHDINDRYKLLPFFDEYLKQGYYPFFTESESLYYRRIEEIVNMIIEVELPKLRNVQVHHTIKVKQLLQVIASSAPFIPNVQSLSEKTGINRNTIVSYLYYLNEAMLTVNLFKNAKGISRMQKPNKILLDNPNLYFAISTQNANTGSVRETFFVNQLKNNHLVEYSEQADFTVDSTYTFEIGGKNKNSKQLTGIENTFLVLDNIEYGTDNIIPLWLFGFLY